MKKFSLIIALIIPLVLSGCAKEEVADNTDTLKIQFNAEETSSSRAAIGSEGFPNGSAFAVWGFMTKDTQTADVFDGQAVTKDTEGNWNCSDVRYWFSGWNYNFYGVYPADIRKSVSVSQSGVIAIDNFDCSNANDLMTAKSDEMSGDTPAQVSMLFKHLLSKVNIMATVEGGNATVTSVTFSGMATQGNYSSTDGWNDTAQGSFTSNESKVLNSTGVDLLGDMLLIPQTITENFKVSVTYTMDEEQKTTEIVLPTANASNWEAGKSYRYTLAFKGNNIIFTVNVVPWDHSAGGIITVE